MNKPKEPKNTCPIIDNSRNFQEEMQWQKDSIYNTIESAFTGIQKKYEEEAEELRECNKDLRNYADELKEYYENLIEKTERENVRLNEKIKLLEDELFNEAEEK